MSDQEVRETSRYARKTITVRGLMREEPNDKRDPNAKQVMADYGVLWDLQGNPECLLGEIKTSSTTTYIEGEEVLSSLSKSEVKWLVDLAGKHGLEVGIKEEESLICAPLPFIESPLVFEDRDGGWGEKVQTVGNATMQINMSRSSRKLTIIIEGSCKDDVANDLVDEWVTHHVKWVREALEEANFGEDRQLEIDCEVIMGAEREAKCDPNLMRSLITKKEDEEE